jgi:peptidoglycan hydrolase-like amidase
MNTTTSHKFAAWRWILGFLTVAIASAAMLSNPGLRNKFIKLEGLTGSISNPVKQEIEFESESDAALTTKYALELPKQDGSYIPSLRVESKEVATVGPFNAVGVRWHATTPDGTTASIHIKLGFAQDWTEWRTVQHSEDAFVAEDPEAFVSDLIFVPNGDRIQVAAELHSSDPTKTPRIEDVRLDFVNTKDGPSAVGLMTAQAQTTSQPAIISRAAWGADESWMTWAPEKATPQVMVVHHSAGSDGGNDPAAVVRGIYHYHAVTLGWGDIGYNFLIDSQGHIYEGRAGGDDTIGGHTTGYNTGSIGIALLGTYESMVATPAAENALVNLAGYLAAKYDLDPSVTKSFIDKQIPTLSGHRDLTQTLCPGTTEHSRLPGIRVSASTARNNYLAGQFHGALESITGNVLAENQPGVATVALRNNGTQTWTNSGANTVTLLTVEPDNHTSPLHTTGWVSIVEPSSLLEASVPPGQIGNFRVPLAAAALGDTNDKLQLFVRGSNVRIEGTALTLTRSVRASISGQVVGLADPIVVEGGTRTDIEVRIKNTGASTWTNTGTNFTALNLTQPKGRTSKFRDSSWPLAYRPGIMTTASVPPDAEGVFKFKVKVPTTPGEYREPMQPVIEKVSFIPGAEFVLHMLVTNPFQSELQERPIQLFAAPDQELQVALHLKNRSSVVWQPNGAGFVALETVQNSANSIFKTAGWISPTRAVAIPHQVGPGTVLALNFPVKAPTQPGDYLESFRLVSDGQSAIDGSTFSLKVTVRAGYQAAIMQADSVTVPANTVARAIVKVKNTGASPWATSGANAVSVVTNNPLKHTSALVTPSWNDGATPTILEPALVSPEQTATLTIELAGAAGGQATESFVLVGPDQQPIPGSEFSLTRIVSGGVTAPSGPLGSNVRVGITSSASLIGVSAAGGYTVKDAQGTTLGSAPSGRVDVAWNGSSYVVNGAVSGSSTHAIRVEPAEGTILELPDYQDHPAFNPSLNDNTFRGVMEVGRAGDGKLYAINELPLELYMRGLGEASSDPLSNYLQALAVAARTYAEYQRSIGGKHPELGYDLDNKNDQVYKGYGLEQRNTDFVNAVSATAGQFVTYQGAVVVTPYFSQSDGRTRSFSEAFGGPEKPWLVSVNVPEDQGQPLLGHGVGMSARAARIRAEAGMSTNDILTSFYTGVAIQKLY